ncbi:MAG: peptidylprolyl isomerase [Pseudomonadota bacterium]
MIPRVADFTALSVDRFLVRPRLPAPSIPCLLAAALLLTFSCRKTEEEPGRAPPGERPIPGGGKPSASMLLTIARSWDPSMAARLKRLLSDGDEVVGTEAARALGIAGATAASTEVAAFAGRTTTSAANRAVIVEALGRIGDAGALPVLASALADQDSGVRAAAGISLGRVASRGIELGGEVLAALELRATDANQAARYGVVYALAQRPIAVEKGKQVVLLERLAADPDPEIRATAVGGLAKLVASHRAFAAALDDDDWRVRAQAVRALSAATATSADLTTLARWIADEWASIGDLDERLVSPRVHPVLEGLARLASRVAEPEVAKVLQRLYESTNTAESTVKERYTPAILRSIDAVNCLAAAGLVRAGSGSLAMVTACGEASGAGWPRSERLRLVAGLVAEMAEGIGKKATMSAAGKGRARTPGTPGAPGAPGKATVPVGELESYLDTLWSDQDPLVKAAAVNAAAALHTPRAIAILAEALGHAHSPIAINAIEALASRAAARQPVDGSLVQAFSERAEKLEKEDDFMLRLAFLEALPRMAIGPAAERICARAFGDRARSLRQTAKDCVEQLTGKSLDNVLVPPVRDELPPVDPASVAGRLVRWVVSTTKGELEVELWPDDAPWSVAALVELAQKGFYDGVAFHRVVPGFVVQGGDPTGSGAGGPGFRLPSEQSIRPFERGTVGIADAGLGTGGSQWFIMHARAPQLEGRYTLVGRVTKGMDVVDSLVIGDRIVTIKTTIETGGLGHPDPYINQLKQ